ncbi:beta-1,4-mannosyltransferase [Marasmius fiardii PR-910]|nr:beta-1,4-mannosyltransferase [Marasmius fiardii PR-910]
MEGLQDIRSSRTALLAFSCDTCARRCWKESSNDVPRRKLCREWLYHFCHRLQRPSGSKPIPALERLPNVQLCYLPEPPPILKWIPFIAAAPFKILHQVITILRELLVNIPEPPEYVMVQNPPSIPTLALVTLVGRIRGCRIIIDWHNTGYSILALKLHDNHPYVRVAKWFEATFGRRAFVHLFVTYAMKDALVEQWDLKGTKLVLHDRPPRHFHRSSPQEKHDLFMKLKAEFLQYKDLHDYLPPFTLPYSTPFTDTSSHTDAAQLTFPTPMAPEPTISTSSNAAYARDRSHPIPMNIPTYEVINPPSLRSDRPALVVSSTSWTPDEDFGTLLDALKIYDKRASEVNARDGEKLPKLLVVVTGKGPERERYMNEVDKLEKEWKWVRCISLWLEAEDYPVFLGSADLGVCLHSSSSQLDLPMKVVDMFGCGLPVCALNFKCLHELVRHGENGLVFEDALQLAEQLAELLVSFPKAPRLASLTASLETATKYSTENSKNRNRWCSWDVHWASTLKPLVLHGIKT